MSRSPNSSIAAATASKELLSNTQERAALEAKYGNKWRGKALREETRGFYVRAWRYQGLMKRMPDRNAAEALQQQQMYEHYSASSEADKKKLRHVEQDVAVRQRIQQER